MIEIRRLRNPATGKSEVMYRYLDFRIQDGLLLIGRRPKWSKWRPMLTRDLADNQYRDLIESGDVVPSDTWDWSLGPKLGKRYLRSRPVITTGV